MEIYALDTLYNSALIFKVKGWELVKSLSVLCYITLKMILNVLVIITEPVTALYKISVNKIDVSHAFKGPATIPNHVDGSRNQVESLAESISH